jgi:hypothetical protein
MISDDPTASGRSGFREREEGNDRPLGSTACRLAATFAVICGLKPGTRVMSVRDGTCGVHTLLLEKTPRG